MIKLRKTRIKLLIMLLKKTTRKPMLKLKLMNKPTRKLRRAKKKVRMKKRMTKMVKKRRLMIRHQQRNEVKHKTLKTDQLFTFLCDWSK